jgi:signal transduction histidine kinase
MTRRSLSNSRPLRRIDLPLIERGRSTLVPLAGKGRQIAILSVRHMKKHGVLFALFASALIFVVDLLTPVGDAVWIFYTIPLLIVASRPGRFPPLAITVLSSVLIVLGYFFSPPYPNVTFDVINRLTGIVVQFVVALVLVRMNRVKEDLRGRTVELEKEIVEREAIGRKLQESQGSLLARIEKERKLEDQLRQSQKMEAIGTLAGGIAHDFNNILAAIIGFSQLALEREADGRPVRQHIEKVVSAGMRGKDLVRRLLAFSRKSEQEKMLLRLSDIVEESVELLRPSLPPGIDVRFTITSASSRVLADRTQMEQVIVNLCTNAAHAIGNNRGVIAIELADVALGQEERPGPALKPGDYVRLTVKDTGKGMTAEVMQRIFDPFFTTKKSGEGTGLGLSIVHGIIEGHGGAIIVESMPGAGTQFSVYMPLPPATIMETHGSDERPRAA